MSFNNIRFDPRIIRISNWVHENLSKRSALILITIVPALSLFILVNLFPIVWSVVAGFYNVPLLKNEWVFVGLENYQSILEDGDFWDSIFKSVLFAGVSVILQLIVGTGIALLVNRDFRFSSIARSLVIVPFTIPTVVLGFIALWMLDGDYGIVNQLLVDIGLVNDFINWFGKPDIAMVSIILVSSWKFSLFVTIMVLARLQSIPDELYEAATMAGASGYQKFRDITLPNLKGVIFIVLLLRGIWMFNKFDIVYVLTGGGPVDATRLVSIYAFEIAFATNRLGKAAAVSTLLFFLLVCVALVYFYTLEPEKEVRVE